MSTTMWAVAVAFLCFVTESSFGVSAQECGGTITEAGLLSSPDPFDEQFKTQKNMECVWRIEAPEYRKVVLKITKYALNKAVICSDQYDHIAVFDGLTTDEEKRLAILCTKGQDFVIPSTGNTLTIKFKTDSFNDMTGFYSQIIFTFPESDGCGGNINLKSDQSYLVRTPRIRNYQIGDAFECVWNFIAPERFAIKISFSSFDKFSCKYNELVEIRDGNLPESLILGAFCGKKIPPVLISSSNRLSVRMSSTDLSQFTAILSAVAPECAPYKQLITEEIKSYRTVKTVGYNTVYLSRGINCGYQFISNSRYPVRVTIKNLDIHPGTEDGKCDKDKLIIGTRSTANSLDKYFSSNYDSLNYLWSTSKLNLMYDKYSFLARQFELCGKKSVEFYFPGTFSLNLLTSSDEADDDNYKGFQINVSYATFCGKNYSETFGRLLVGPGGNVDECYTLISAPQGYTISLYFLSFHPAQGSNNNVSLDVYDGKTTEASKIMSAANYQALNAYNVPKSIFSTTNYLLIKNKRTNTSQISYDANYMITSNGQGCGGYYYADQGVLSSPFYPETYKKTKYCEWEIETPVSTLLHLTFDEFDLKGDCTSNYVELVDSDGQVLSRYCSEKPGKFKSNDNYVKIVYVTGPSNNGKGWHAMFRAGECLRCRRHR